MPTSMWELLLLDGAPEGFLDVPISVRMGATDGVVSGRNEDQTLGVITTTGTIGANDRVSLRLGTPTVTTLNLTGLMEDRSGISGTYTLTTEEGGEAAVYSGDFAMVKQG